MATVSQADHIRKYALEHYVVPARRRGIEEVTIRAGDVHHEMALASAMPAVCSAIGSLKFEALASATLTGRSGPTNGANVFFRFRLLPDAR